MRVLAFWIIVLSSALSGCKDQQKIQVAQEQLHQEILDRFDASLEQVQKHAQQALKQFLDAYNHQSICKADGPSEKSSFYIPKSAHSGKGLDCFRAASRQLDGLFDKFNHDVNFISWQYLYDGDSKTLRLFPATNTGSLFGADLVFDNFSFYKDGIASMPNPSWGGLKDDINGTGAIYIHSVPVLLSGHVKPTTISFDARPTTLLQAEDQTIFTFHHNFNLKNMFLIAFDMNGKNVVKAHEFGTNLQLWTYLKSNQGNLLNLPDVQLATFMSATHNVSITGQSTSLQSEIKDINYFCTIKKSKIVGLITILCSAT